MVIIRIGEGRSPSGKILDKETQWLNISSLENKLDAIKIVEETKKKIYLLNSHKKYEEITLAQLKAINI